MTTIERAEAWKQRAAVGTYFFVLGAAVGSWVSRIPEVQTALKISNGLLGLALLMPAIGALITMPLAGQLAPRVGTRRLALIAASSMCLILPLIPLAPKPIVLMIILTAYGASTGVLGVVINALAVQVEENFGRPILSSFHGIFSLGCLGGAAIASLLVRMNIGPVVSLVGAAILLGSALLTAFRKLPTATAGPSARRITNPPRSLVVVGCLVFLGFVGEGAMTDWSAVYLQQSLSAPASVAALGFAAYSLGMTVGRFTGDRLARLASDEAIVRGGAGLAAAGLGAALIIRHPIAAVIGFGMVGAGLANVVPILFRAASRVPGVAPVAGIATASSIGYLGFLAGPPIIGGIANYTSLPIALSLVTTAVICVALGGGVVNNLNTPQEKEDASIFEPYENAISPAAESYGS